METVEVETNILGSFLTGLKDSLNKLYPMNAIWLGEPVKLASGQTTRRVEPGNIIVLNNESFKVSKCYGTFSSSELYMDLVSEAKGESVTLKLR